MLTGKEDRMGQKDNLTKKYMSDKERFADAFNYFLYEGKQVINKDDLQEKDPTELIITGKNRDIFSKQKMRDVLKQCLINTSDSAVYVMMGIENQTDIHYAMPIRNLLYDSLNYAAQAELIGKVHEKRQDLKGSEFFSRFAKNDHIKPVITLTIYWGNKEWDGCERISDMFPPNTPSEIRKYACDYSINLINPKKVKDFRLFRSELGDVLEFISRSDCETTMKDMLEERDNKWIMSRDGVNVINVMTSSNIEPENEDDEEVDMCRATQALIEEGIEKGITKGEDLFASLIRIIRDDKDEMDRALSADEETRQEMYRKYGLIE